MTSDLAAILAGFPEISNDQMLLIVLLGGVSLLVLVVTRRRIARRQESGRNSSSTRDLRRAAPGAFSTEQQQLRQSMQDLLLQLEEVSREINSQVDTRLRAMNLLIQEADQKIDELRRLQGRDADASPTRNLPPPRPEPNPDATSERYAKVYALAERGRSVVEIARDMDMMTGEVELILALRRTARGREENA